MSSGTTAAVKEELIYWATTVLGVGCSPYHYKTSHQQFIGTLGKSLMNLSE